MSDVAALRRALIDACREAGGIAPFARVHGLSPSGVSDAIHGRTERPGPRYYRAVRLPAPDGLGERHREAAEPTSDAVPDGARRCKGPCQAVKPLESFRLVVRRGRSYRERTCLACRTRWQHEYDQRRKGRWKRRGGTKPMPPDYFRRRREQELVKLMDRRNHARERVRHWQQAVKALGERIEEMRSI